MNLKTNAHDQRKFTSIGYHNTYDKSLKKTEDIKYREIRISSYKYNDNNIESP